MSQSRPTRRAPAVSDAHPITWRGGVHIGGTEIWCDARRAREVCFVSCAHAVDASRHGQLIATQVTLDLLARADAKLQPRSELSVPYNRPFTIGTRRLELVRSGHSVGSAALLLDLEGHRILYAGAVNPAGGGLGGAADVRACDTLIIAARYGDSRFVFPEPGDAAAAVSAFVAEVHAHGGMAVLLVTSPSKGIDVAHRLSADKIQVIAHRSIHHAAQRIRGRVELPKLRRWSGKPPRTAGPMRALVWPIAARAALSTVELPGHSKLALVSGDAQDAETLARCEVDAAFVWSNRADHARLLEYVDTSGARRVYFTDRHARVLAAALDRPKRRAFAVGPPVQMSLFR